MKVIAHIKTDFKEKFGIPRQSGLVEEAKGKIVFEKEYRVKEAFQELDKFSHIWILWQFSEHLRDTWSSKVRPPLLGGNKKVGVFATRSPFRPNPIGLSSVKLEKIEYSEKEGPILFVSGVDLLDGTPIFDIKPYLPYTDSHPDATGGFTETLSERSLSVEIRDKSFFALPKELQTELKRILSLDPRPSYQEDGKTYGMAFNDYEIKFTVEDGTLYLLSIDKKENIL